MRHWSEIWCPGYLKHALSSSEIHFAVAKTLEIICHVSNCCKRPIIGRFLGTGPLKNGISHLMCNASLILIWNFDATESKIVKHSVAQEP